MSPRLKSIKNFGIKYRRESMNELEQWRFLISCRILEMREKWTEFRYCPSAPLTGPSSEKAEIEQILAYGEKVWKDEKINWFKYKLFSETKNLYRILND
jgi:hypothetical protein